MTETRCAISLLSLVFAINSSGGSEAPSGARTVLDAEYADAIAVAIGDLDLDGHLQTPDHFRVTHLLSISTGVDAVHDTPLLIEHAEDVSTGTILPPGPLIFEDGFETGNTPRWSARIS